MWVVPPAESPPPLQDVLVVNCSKDFMASNHVLATCRTALKKQGIVGLNAAPCMRAFLERLPIMLQEQYAYEKVVVLPEQSLEEQEEQAEQEREEAPGPSGSC